MKLTKVIDSTFTYISFSIANFNLYYICKSLYEHKTTFCINMIMHSRLIKYLNLVVASDVLGLNIHELETC